ncbi:MAG: isoprenylcysteine carboxylmethyltransferase family protein [Planctomycetaceae bacterium]|jgi:protein-S-isoprenylcysteine O-methyltransferase Ste14|nr:isoprenylcysteine carboxylmethyltransferase family protein [Planctomycetaceae bacterium]
MTVKNVDGNGQNAGNNTTGALYNEMTAQGLFLFRWRSYLPLLFVIMMILVLYTYEPLFDNPVKKLCWQLLALLIGLIGLIIRSLVIGYAPARTSGRNVREHIADTLNTSGMYALTRNPLYLGNFFMWLAPLLLLHNIFLAIIYLLLFVLYYERIVASEETFLISKFGTQYQDWAGKTPFLFPRCCYWKKPELPFSWKTVIRREYHGLYGLIVSMTAVVAICDFIVCKHFVINPVWTGIFIFGTLVYITVRIVVKTTRVLNVAGRH